MYDPGYSATMRLALAGLLVVAVAGVVRRVRR
jgi:hypothetical protein